MILKIRKELKKDVDKVKKMMYKQNGSISKEIENMKKSQKEILQLKSITEILKIAKVIQKPI